MSESLRCKVVELNFRRFLWLPGLLPLPTSLVCPLGCPRPFAGVGSSLIALRQYYLMHGSQRPSGGGFHLYCLFNFLSWPLAVSALLTSSSSPLLGATEVGRGPYLVLCSHLPLTPCPHPRSIHRTRGLEPDSHGLLPVVKFPDV